MVPLNPIVITGEEDKHEVERILRHCQRGWAMEYLVYWHGCNEIEDSWVSEQDLVHAQQILQ